MTPKEKAEELFEKFNNPDTTHHPYVHNAQQCTLIAVDEMIIQNGELFLNGLDGDYYRKKNAFLFEVKQEIEKL
jgi:hypothetical protein